MLLQPKPKVLLKIGIGLFTLWLIGFCLFIYNVFSKHHCEPENLDAVVLVTGKSRLIKGLQIFTNLNAKKLLISGIGDKVRESELYTIIRQKGVDSKRITFGYLAKNTLDNAIETRIFAQIHNYKRFCIITSDYHLPRTALVFKHILPDLELSFAEIETTHDGSLSARAKFTLRIFKEYNKYLLAAVLTLDTRISRLYDKCVLELAKKFS